MARGLGVDAADSDSIPWRTAWGTVLLGRDTASASNRIAGDSPSVPTQCRQAATEPLRAAPQRLPRWRQRAPQEHRRDRRNARRRLRAGTRHRTARGGTPRSDQGMRPEDRALQQAPRPRRRRRHRRPMDHRSPPRTPGPRSAARLSDPRRQDDQGPSQGPRRCIARHRRRAHLCRTSRQGRTVREREGGEHAAVAESEDQVGQVLHPSVLLRSGRGPACPGSQPMLFSPLSPGSACRRPTCTPSADPWRRAP